MAGTVAEMTVGVAVTVNAAGTPANLTAVTPVKFDPVMLTFVPAEPDVGVNELILGGDVTAAAGAAGASTPRDKAMDATRPRRAVVPPARRRNMWIVTIVVTSRCS